MKGFVCLGSALAFHVAIVAVAVARAPGAPNVHVVDGTSIEVDEIVPKHIETLDDPVERLPEVAHPSPMRGAPAHVNIVAVAASVATSTDVVPDPPPVDVPTPPRFKLGGEGGGNAKAAPTAHADRTFSESEVTERATLLSGPKPVYPATALADGIELDAPLAFEIVVDTNGAVISTRPLGVAGHGFDEAALSAVRAFHFTPAKRDGDLVRVRMRWTVEFHLKG